MVDWEGGEEDRVLSGTQGVLMRVGEGVRAAVSNVPRRSLVREGGT
jgi:hypothetical protein